jgi:hypothetical protein
MVPSTVSSTPATEKPIFLPLRSAIAFTDPSSRVIRQLSGESINVPTRMSGISA